MKLTTFAVAAATVAANTEVCQDTKKWDNVECDYRCNQTDNKCECPAGWELADKGAITDKIDTDAFAQSMGGSTFSGHVETGHNCYPEANKITVTCSATNVQVVFDETLFGSSVTNLLTVGNCAAASADAPIVDDSATSGANFYKLSLDYGKCGFTPSLNSDTNAHFEWTADIELPAANSGVIQKTASRKIKVGCRVPRFGYASDNTVKVQGEAVAMDNLHTNTLSSIAVTYDLNAYSDSNHQTLASEFNSGVTVYMKAIRNELVTDVNTLLTVCEIKNAAGDKSFNLIEGCTKASGTEVNDINMAFTQGANTNVQTFSFSSFLFSGANNGDAQTITCNFLNCLTADCATDQGSGGYCDGKTTIQTQ